MYYGAFRAIPGLDRRFPASPRRQNHPENGMKLSGNIMNLLAVQGLKRLLPQLGVAPTLSDGRGAR
jgi:hypothetical protein